MVGNPVQNGRHLDGHAVIGKLALEDGRAVGFGEDRFLQRASDLPSVDVEGRDQLDVTDAVFAHMGVHQSGYLTCFPVLVILQAL